RRNGGTGSEAPFRKSTSTSSLPTPRAFALHLPSSLTTEAINFPRGKNEMPSSKPHFRPQPCRYSATRPPPSTSPTRYENVSSRHFGKLGAASSTTRSSTAPRTRSSTSSRPEGIKGNHHRRLRSFPSLSSFAHGCTGTRLLHHFLDRHATKHHHPM